MEIDTQCEKMYSAPSETYGYLEQLSHLIKVFAWHYVDNQELRLLQAGRAYSVFFSRCGPQKLEVVASFCYLEDMPVAVL